MNKKFVSLIIAAITAATSVASVFAGGYYNAINEVTQIKTMLRRGMYLEAIRDCENTIAWHDLSPNDIMLFESIKQKAEKRYNDYVNGIDMYYYNASAEINQIKSFVNRGLYLEAMRDCENTADWHYLSPNDIAILNDLYDTANSKYSAYRNSINPVYTRILNAGAIYEGYDTVEDTAIIIKQPTDYQRSLIDVTDYAWSDDSEALDGDYIIIPKYVSSSIKIYKVHQVFEPYSIIYNDYLYYDSVAESGCAVEYRCFDPEIWARSKITVTAPNGNVTEYLPHYGGGH